MSETTPTPSPAPAWRVTGQVEDTRVSVDGRVETGVKVLFRTAAGVDSSVFVPNAQYSATAVLAAISERVAVLDAVSGLTGDGLAG